jgi:hypothetical protein
MAQKWTSLRERCEFAVPMCRVVTDDAKLGQLLARLFEAGPSESRVRPIAGSLRCRRLRASAGVRGAIFRRYTAADGGPIYRLNRASGKLLAAREKLIMVMTRTTLRQGGRRREIASSP